MSRNYVVKIINKYSDNQHPISFTSIKRIQFNKNESDDLLLKVSSRKDINFKKEITMLSVKI